MHLKMIVIIQTSVRTQVKPILSQRFISFYNFLIILNASSIFFYSLQFSNNDDKTLQIARQQIGESRPPKTVIINLKKWNKQNQHFEC